MELMSTHAFPVFCRNGEILPIEEATIPLQSIEYSYGFGVYETIRVIDSVPFFAKEHIQRLIKSASMIGLKHTLTKEDLSQWIDMLLNECNKDRINLKILLIGAQKPQDTLLVILPLNPLFPDKRFYKKGVETIIAEYERPIPNAKTLNMLRSYLAQKKAKEQGCYEALSIHSDGCIYEGSRSNFFVVKNSTITTPPKETILEGITREIIFKLARENGIEVHEETISFSRLAEYDGAFLTSSSSKLMPIRKIDGVEFAGIPETTKKLMKLYDTFLSTSKGMM